MIFALLLGLVTVDERVQEAAARAGAEAVVVLEAKSGQVIAKAGRVDRPMPPGSTFKLVTALAAADQPEGLAGTVKCIGPASVAGHAIAACPPGGHGEVSLEEAIAQSCNLFFATVGERAGTKAIVDKASSLGVGLGAGRLPEKTAPAALVATGDGVLVTAMQQARLARQIALGKRDGVGETADPATMGRIRAGMRAAVDHGTSSTAKSSVPVAGKTGTATMGGSEIGWFIGYAPADDPTIVVAIARRGVMGREAARSAGTIFDAYFHGR